MKRTSILCAALLFSGSAFAGQAGHGTPESHIPGSYPNHEGYKPSPPYHPPAPIPGQKPNYPTPTPQTQATPTRAAPTITNSSRSDANANATASARSASRSRSNAKAYGGQGGNGGSVYNARDRLQAPGMAIGFSSGTCVPYGLLGSVPGAGFGFQFPDNSGVCPSLEIAKFLAANGCRDAALAVAVGGDRIRALQDYPCGTPRQVVLRRRY